MSKPENLLKPKQIRLTGNQILEHYLEKLVNTGFYGNNTTQAAAIVLSREVERLVKAELIEAPDDVLAKSRK